VNKTVLAGVALVMAAVTVPGAAAGADQHLPPNPKQFCDFLAQNEPEAYEFLATQPGACESSIASVGIEALMSGAFPSIAAAVGNCKFLEENFFVGNEELGLPDYLDDGRAYPYQFYWFEGVDDPNL
jgi:hypothetical protein